jgi:hypothetical protein
MIPPPDSVICARALSDGKTSSAAAGDGCNLQLYQSLPVPLSAANLQQTLS